MLNTSLYIRAAIVGIVLFQLSGCQTAPPKPPKVIPQELQSFPVDVKATGNNIIDVQKALADRNLYMSDDGYIKMLDTGLCPIEISAHRGDFREAESSISAIVGATSDNYDSIEIDVMKLWDDRWVNHHDHYTGRATVHSDGKRYDIERMNTEGFTELNLRDKETGDLLPYRPAIAYEVFEAFANTRKPGQRLNVEIKSTAQRKHLAYLDHMLKTVVGRQNYYYSSSDMETLETLRELNSSVYLGLIQQAQPESVRKLRSDIRSGVKHDAYYRYNQKELERAADRGTKRYVKYKYKDYRNISGLADIKARLGTNSGLHLDIRGYMATPMLTALANSIGLKVYTYSINGSDFHQNNLVKLKKSQLPDGIIVDTTPYKICQKLFKASKPSGQYRPSSSLGWYISKLPVDADFDSLEEMLGYSEEGYYINLAGKLKSLSETSRTKNSHRKKISNSPLYFPEISDQKIQKSESQAIIITLPQS